MFLFHGELRPILKDSSDLSEAGAASDGEHSRLSLASFHCLWLWLSAVWPELWIFFVLWLSASVELACAVCPARSFLPSVHINRLVFGRFSRAHRKVRASDFNELILWRISDINSGSRSTPRNSVCAKWGFANSYSIFKTCICYRLLQPDRDWWAAGSRSQPWCADSEMRRALRWGEAVTWGFCAIWITVDTQFSATGSIYT